MNLLIKDFPDELVRRMKAEAAGSGKTLKELVVEKCTATMKSESENCGTGAGVEAKTESLVPSKPKVARKGVGSVSTGTGGVSKELAARLSGVAGGSYRRKIRAFMDGDTERSQRAPKSVESTTGEDVEIEKEAVDAGDVDSHGGRASGGRGKAGGRGRLGAGVPEHAGQREGEGSGGSVHGAGPGRRGTSGDPDDRPNVDRHNPKECPTYRCGLCRVAGHLDAHRGLA